MEIPDLSKEEGLSFLNTYLKDKSYIGGYHATKADVSVWDKLRKCPSDQYENVFRWYNHIHSYGSERNSLPNSEIEIKFFQPECCVKTPEIAQPKSEVVQCVFRMVKCPNPLKTGLIFYFLYFVSVSCT